MPSSLAAPVPASTSASSRIAQYVDKGPREPRSHLRLALWLLGSALLMAVATLVLFRWLPYTELAVTGFLLSSAMAVWGATRALVGLYRSVAQRDVVRPLPIVLHVVALLGNAIMALVGVGAALLSTANFSRGRQLRRFGRVLLAPVEQSHRWLSSRVFAARPDVPDSLRSALAEQWRENGRTEHASVAAFSRLSLDLMALGAPAALIASAHADALDEIRHAELCFELARAIDGQAISPGAFPAAGHARTLPSDRLLALSVLAVDSLVDGALHEGVSARVVARLARRTEEPAIRALLKQIAVDEGRHAAHGWDVVEFCLAEGGAAVAHALSGALKALPKQLATSFGPEARRGAWERFGIPGEATERAEFAKARADVLCRVARLTAAHVAAGSSSAA